MATTILEMPETPPTPETPAEPAQNTPPASVETPEVPESPATPEKPDGLTPATPAPQEPTFDIDGEKLTAAQIKEWKEKYGRDSKWIQTNEERAAALNQQEEELRQLRLIKPLIEQRPDVLQQLFQPPQQRNFETELQQLYAQRPDPYNDPQNYAAWEMRKDQLNSERTASLLEQKNRMDYEQRMAFEHNQQTEKYGKDKYLETKILSPTEFNRMNQWIIENAKAVNNRYPKEAYDIAFKALFEDKFIASAKLSATQKAIAPLKADQRPPASPAIKPPEVQRTDEDIEDDTFVKAVRSRNSKYKKLAET